MKKLLLILLCLPLLFSSCSMQTEKEKELSEICNNINSLTPMMINDSFEFSSIECDFPMVNLKYRYTEYEMESYEVNEEMKLKTLPEVEAPVNDNEGFKDFRDAGYTFFMEYLDKNHQSLFSFHLRKSSNGIYKIVELKQVNGKFDLVEIDRDEELTINITQEKKDDILEKIRNKHWEKNKDKYKKIFDEEIKSPKEKSQIKLGEYYKPIDTPSGFLKAKDLNFQIKQPLGFEQLEADRPNIVQKWIKNRKENTMVIFMIQVNNLSYEMQDISQGEWMQYFKYGSGIDDFKPDDTHNLKFNIIKSKYYVLDNYYGIYYEGKYEGERLSNEIGSHYIRTQVFLNKHMFSITMSTLSKDILDDNKELFRLLANSVIFPDQYGN